MANKKRLATTVGAIALTAVLAIGGTLAYLSQVTETKKNMFTGSDNLKTTITETEWKGGEDYTPGKAIAKNPVITNLADSSTSIYAGVKIQFYDHNNKPISYNTFAEKYATVQYKDATGAFKDGFNPAWVVDSTTADSTKGLFLNYNTEIAPGNPTAAVFDQVTVNYGIKKEWNQESKVTTVYPVKTDENGNYVTDEKGNYVPDTSKPIESTTEVGDTSVTFVDSNGVVVDAFVLPQFQIDVTGYAVQSADLTLEKGVIELKALAGLNK